MKKKKKKETEIKTTLDIIPVRYYDDDSGGFVLNDNSYMDMMEIVPQDRQNLQMDELQFIIYGLAKFYKLYAPDIKIITLNFPVNTSKQRKILKRLIKKTTDEVRKKWLEREIQELIKLDNNVNRREFFLFFYGRNQEDYLKNRTTLIEWSGFGKDILFKPIEKEKKIQIVRKICNMNSLILPDDLKGEEDDE